MNIPNIPVRSSHIKFALQLKHIDIITPNRWFYLLSI